MAKRRPLRYRGVSDARIKQLQPLVRLIRRLLRFEVTNDHGGNHHD